MIRHNTIIEVITRVLQSLYVGRFMLDDFWTHSENGLTQ